ncbi:glycosyltransferase family 2 protein [Paenibacillus sp. KQZ6P-2]|uniref:Glycosyltransferase family 2 protein n=1 Tax=Paenibacillus mangrovi TaxID=2931978 RepID=A0A9X1WQD5_9BACL|nr:glycosyltransferase family 2 protein [Paenibacillus mangrovi]MCJ8012746.1 glycosyltransferase family 2 protein [Paenibacillus mangrovi]
MENLISLCMIVKNEEKLISRCLESVKKLVDEIIIIDTGSIDKTKSIARQYTNHVYDYKWNDDFAAARNESLRHATGKWILILDADEYIKESEHDFEKLRQYLNSQNPNQPCCYILKILNLTGNGYDETNIIESSGARLFNNNVNIHYSQPIHEQLTVANGTIEFKNILLTLHHSGYIHEIVNQKNKSHRNMEILKTMETGNKDNPYYHFILGNEYSNSGESDLALQSYHLSYEKSSPRDTWFFHLMDRLITTELEKAKYSDAFEHIQTGKKLKPQFVDYYCFSGILLDSLGFLKAAANEFKKCIELAEEANKKNHPYWIVQPTFGNVVPLEMLGEISRKKGNISIAIMYWIKALVLQPKNFRISQTLIDHLVGTESIETTKDILNKLYPRDHAINNVLLYKMALNTADDKLVHIYKREIDNAGIKLKYEDRIQTALFLKKPIVFEECQEKVPSHIAVMAAILTGQSEWIRLASDNKETCLLLVEQIQKTFSNQTIESNVLANHEQLLSKVLFFMWKYNYREEYFLIVNEVANEKTLNMLLQLFYRSGKLEDTLDLATILLESNILDAEGHKLMAQWSIIAKDPNQANMFIMASINEPPIDYLGLITENSDDIANSKEMLELYYCVYPELLHLSF